MSNWHRLLVGGTILALLAGMGSGAHSQQVRPGGAPTLILVIDGADESLRRETAAILGLAQDELVRSSGFATVDTVRVIYVGRHQSFDSVLGGRFPDWGIAAAIGERNLIAVRSPADYPLGRSLRETLRHELAHLHIDAMSGLRQIPRWMHEGFAQHFAHEWVFGDDFLIARAVFTDETINLRDIDGVNSFSGQKAQLAYSESYIAMGHFLSSYGSDGLGLFCQTVRESGDWDAAFKTATGAGYDAFQNEFAEHLRSRYNWIAFLGDTILLWIGLAGVFIVIYVVKRRKSAARRAEWEKQEAIEDILYGPFDRRPPGDQSPPDST